MKAKRHLSHLQLSRAAGCPVCGAAPFELCMNIPQDPLTHTRYVHGARLRRLKRKVSALARVTGKARQRLLAGRRLREAA